MPHACHPDASSRDFGASLRGGALRVLVQLRETDQRFNPVITNEYLSWAGVRGPEPVEGSNLELPLKSREIATSRTPRDDNLCLSPFIIVASRNKQLGGQAGFI